MKPQEEAALANGVLHIPVVVGAVAIVYNIDTKTPLKLDGETLGQIYLGTIKTWNDAHIAKLNPGVKLPELAITPMFRSDGSGTTGVFTDYLCKVNSQFKSVVGQGKAVTWPSGAGGKGNAGVAALVTQTPGAIGYVELTYALSNAMKFAEMKNADNVFILPTEHAAQAAAESVAAEMPANQYKMSITNLKGKHAYPISAFSWLLISKKWNAEKGGPMRELLSYVLSPTAQKAATSLHYAPLPQSLIRALDNEISKIDFGTKASEIAR